MFKQTRCPAWMFLCIATLVFFSALSALAQVAPLSARAQRNRTSANGPCHASSGCTLFPCAILMRPPWLRRHPPART